MSPVVVVTGASAGIGRATVTEFTRRGDQMALIARGQTGLDAAAAACQELGAKTLTVPTDVSDANAIAEAVDRIETELGPIDEWDNLAFTSVFSQFDDITPEEYSGATAADHSKRREYWVGASTVGTLIANAIAPGILDRYLGRTGFASQQNGDLNTADNVVNLWEPTDGEQDGDFGTRGVFDDKALVGSPQQWIAQRYPTVGIGAALVTVAAGVWLAVGRRR